MQFGPLQHHYFGDRRLHSNDEVDIFGRELLRMEEPDLFCDVIRNSFRSGGNASSCSGRITSGTLNFAVTS
jgi:hypothetical protein